jgi:hypothetical protein
MWAAMHAGQVWPAVEGGGPAGSFPPHSFKLYFKEVSEPVIPLFVTLADP